MTACRSRSACVHSASAYSSSASSTSSASSSSFVIPIVYTKSLSCQQLFAEILIPGRHSTGSKMPPVSRGPRPPRSGERHLAVAVANEEHLASLVVQLVGGLRVAELHGAVVNLGDHVRAADQVALDRLADLNLGDPDLDCLVLRHFRSLSRSLADKTSLHDPNEKSTSMR